MSLSKIYNPIRNELGSIERVLAQSLESTSDKYILEINRYLLESPGKRLRPALVILSAYASKSSQSPRINQEQIVALGAAVELIHMASLIHDDSIDHADMRHNKPSIDAKWGTEVSIALGDYLYAKAFELVAVCKNTEVLKCLSQAMAAMCEGELIQVKERDNLELKKRQYLFIVKQKTAALMASCCRAGSASVNGKLIYKEALSNYGLNFGIASQVMDDYRDLTSKTEDLGKPAGLDWQMGEVTLPFLLLPKLKRKKLLNSNTNLSLIKEALDKSGAFLKTRQFIEDYINRAKKSLRACENSCYKESLAGLTDFINPALSTTKISCPIRKGGVNKRV